MKSRYIIFKVQKNSKLKEICQKYFYRSKDASDYITELDRNDAGTMYIAVNCSSLIH